MEEKIQKFQLLVALSILAICILLSSTVIASKFQTGESVTVTGSASKEVKSDSGKLSFTIQTREKNQKQAYAKIKEFNPKVIEYLNAQGFEKEDIDIRTISGYSIHKTAPNGMGTDEIIAYNAEETFEIVSGDVYKIKNTAGDIGSLATDFININVSQPEYYFSNLGEIKVELLKEASKDAKNRAKSMLSATGSGVGKVKEMRMGVFQITPPNSTMVADFGYNDTTTIEKKVTAVANVVFKVK